MPPRRRAKCGRSAVSRTRRCLPDIMRELTTVCRRTPGLTRVRVTENSVGHRRVCQIGHGDSCRNSRHRPAHQVEFAAPTFRDTRTNTERFVIKKMELEDYRPREESARWKQGVDFCDCHSPHFRLAVDGCLPVRQHSPSSRSWTRHGRSGSQNRKPSEKNLALSRDGRKIEAGLVSVKEVAKSDDSKLFEGRRRRWPLRPCRTPSRDDHRQGRTISSERVREA